MCSSASSGWKPSTLSWRRRWRASCAPIVTRSFAIWWRLAVWRTALVLLLPLAMLTWLVLWMIDVGVTCYALAATVVYLTAERLLPRPEWLARLLFGCSVKELSAETPTGPAWLESIL